MNEKIKIENFGPIRYAELDLKKVNVLIGPVASGKSIISKLIHICRYNHLYLKEHKSTYLPVLLKEWQLDLFIDVDFLIVYENGSEKYEIDYKVFLEFSHFNKKGIAFFQNEALDRTLFIPAERIFHSEYVLALPSLFQFGAPTSPTTTQFANKYLKAINDQKRIPINFLNVEIDYSGEVAEIILSDSKRIPLLFGASGIQAVAPVCTLIEYNREWYSANLPGIRRLYMIIEEPELNLHPSAQKAFIEYLISEVSNGKGSENSLLLTTHSPYVISSLDNCLQAQNTYIERRDLQDDIDMIISQKAWLKFENISAYQLIIKSDGKSEAETILDRENRMIMGNKIDDVSLSMEKQFQQLIELRFQNHVL